MSSCCMPYIILADLESIVKGSLFPHSDETTSSQDDTNYLGEHAIDEADTEPEGHSYGRPGYEVLLHIIHVFPLNSCVMYQNIFWHGIQMKNYRMSILLSNVLLLTERASYLLSSSYTIINDPIEVTTRTLASESHGKTVKYPWYKLKFDICELCNGKFLEGSLRRYLHDRHNKLNQTGHQEKFPAADLSLPNNILDHLKAQDITIDEYYNRHVKLSSTNIAFIQTPLSLLSELKH